MAARGGITLFHVRGIRIGVDWSWFVVLFFIILWLSGFYESVLGEGASSTAAYGLAVLSALAFFGSILLHELGHAVVALKHGIGITHITLWLFGGIAHMARDTDSPGTEFKVAVAGPLVTLAIALASIGAGVALAGSEQDFVDAMLVEDGAEVPGSLALLGWLATLNILVLFFNLIPAYPLDGGRIARAIAWRMTGNRNKATRFAAGVGQAFSYAFIGIGIALVFVPGAAFTGIWIALIGVLLGGAARGAARQSVLASRIDDLCVADVMDPEPVAIPQDTTVERALDEFFLRYGWPWFPVTDGAERFTGLVERDAADSVPASDRASRRVGEIAEPDEETGSLRVRGDEPLSSLIGNATLGRLGALAAVDADGRLQGIVTAQQVGRALREAVTEEGKRPDGATPS